MKLKRYSLLIAIILITLSGCNVLSGAPTTASGPLKASGTISADTIRISAEVGGRIVDLKAAKGDPISTGDLVFRLDDSALKAQRDQAQAAVDSAQSAIATAQAAVQTAQAGLDLAKSKQASAQVTYDQAVQAAQMQDYPAQAAAWGVSQPEQFKLQAWYFNKDEQIKAARVEIDKAQKALDTELADLDKTLKDATTSDFVTAEVRLANAQAGFKIAKQTLQQATDARADKTLVDRAQESQDQAQSELDAAQKDYDGKLSTTAATKVLEARARVAVARQRVYNAQDSLNKLLTGPQSLQITAAKAGLDQAVAGVTQAQAGLDQAKAAVTQAQSALAQSKAALAVIDVSLSKMSVTSPSTGVVLDKPLNLGEIAAPGATVVEIAALDNVTLTVYIPENQYGKIQLGQNASISVDTYPGKVFTGKVVLIANQAEFTPRNVQTVESRSTTVFAVDISLPNPNHDLKPGMPADATFE